MEKDVARAAEEGRRGYKEEQLDYNELLYHFLGLLE